MTSRERVTIALDGGIPDRVPYQDAFWATTIERWHSEGLPADQSPADHFGCEIAKIGGDYTLQLPVEIVEETDRYRTYWDADGTLRKVLQTQDGWTPLFLDFRTKDRAAWERVKEQAKYRASRLPGNLADSLSVARQKGQFVAYGAHACFHPTWHRMGMERMFEFMIEDPDFVTDMFEAHTKLITDIYDAMKSAGVDFDGAWLSDDLGYTAAPLISPGMYRDLVKPYHKQACDHFARDGLKTIFHSDGNVAPLIPDFLDAGFSALNPLEAKAGLDVRDLKPKYGDSLTLFGNIDVRALAGTRDDIEEEIRAKVGFGHEHGGYIFHADHSVPNDVSLESYRFAMEMLHKYGSTT